MNPIKTTLNASLTPLKSLSDRLDKFVEGKLWLKVLIALAAGVVFGLILGPDLNWFEADTVRYITAWLALPGQIFLAMIQMIVVPLVIASIVRGLASNNDPNSLKRIGGIALCFIALTTITATAIGISLAQLIEPGNRIEMAAISDTGSSSVATPNTQPGKLPSLAEMPDKVVALIPTNPMASMVSGEMLQVIMFSAVLGFALLSIPQKQAQPLFDLLGALQEVSMRVVSWAMLLAPIAVFGMITKLVANLGIDVLAGMLMYVITVISGLLVMMLIYLIIIKLIGRIPLKVFIRDTKELLLLAFSTSSSAAVMPLSLKTTENLLGVRPSIARFLIPLGATINMTGTALYQGVATVFLAQVFQIDLTLTSYIFIITMSVAASIGSPATPGAGIVILSMVLEGVGIPAAGMALLLGVDRILDMSRSAVNVLGDVVVCNLAEHLLDPEEEDATPNKTAA